MAFLILVFVFLIKLLLEFECFNKIRANKFNNKNEFKLKFFRAISVIEGFSYLAILSVTIGLISYDYVRPIGMTHGVLFILYLFSSLQVSHKQGWSLFIWLAVFLAPIIPFAFISVELFLRRESERKLT